VEDCHVLEGLHRLELLLDDDRRLAHERDLHRRHLADDPRRQGRARERDPLEDRFLEPQGHADLADAVLAELDEGFADLVAEGLLRVDADLLEDIMLALDPGRCLLDVGEDRALQEHRGLAFQHEVAEHLLVEGLGDSLPFKLGILDVFLQPALERTNCSSMNFFGFRFFVLISLYIMNASSEADC